MGIAVAWIISGLLIWGMLYLVSLYNRYMASHMRWYNSLTPEQQAQYHREVFSTSIPRVRRRRRRSKFFKTSSEDTGMYRVRWGGLGGMMK